MVVYIQVCSLQVQPRLAVWVTEVHLCDAVLHSSIRVETLQAMLYTSTRQLISHLQTLTPCTSERILSSPLTMPGCVMSAGVGGLQASTTGDGGRQCGWGAGEATGGHQGGGRLALPQWVQP